MLRPAARTSRMPRSVRAEDDEAAHQCRPRNERIRAGAVSGVCSTTGTSQ
jgi:hypothetical protein